MQSQEYKNALMGVLKSLDDINEKILDGLINVSINNEFKEWNDLLL